MTSILISLDHPDTVFKTMASGCVSAGVLLTDIAGSGTSSGPMLINLKFSYILLHIKISNIFPFGRHSQSNTTNVSLQWHYDLWENIFFEIFSLFNVGTSSLQKVSIIRRDREVTMAQANVTSFLHVYVIPVPILCERLLAIVQQEQDNVSSIRLIFACQLCDVPGHDARTFYQIKAARWFRWGRATNIETNG